jgi:hypothetical protein
MNPMIDEINGWELDARQVHLSVLGGICVLDQPSEDDGELDSAACYVGQLHGIDAKFPRVMIMKGEWWLGTPRASMGHLARLWPSKSRLINTSSRNGPAVGKTSGIS